jgi:hypothetical protein
MLELLGRLGMAELAVKVDQRGLLVSKGAHLGREVMAAVKVARGVQ